MFLYRGARHGVHRVAQAFDVLHVYRGIHIYPRFKQLRYILAAVAVAAARPVSMRQIVYQYQRWRARQHRIQVDFSVLCQRGSGQTLQRGQQARRAGVPVRVYHAGGHVRTLSFLPQGLLQHGAGFARAGRVTHKQLEPAAPLRGGPDRLPSCALTSRRAIIPSLRGFVPASQTTLRAKNASTRPISQ